MLSFAVSEGAVQNLSTALLWTGNYKLKRKNKCGGVELERLDLTTTCDLHFCVTLVS